MIKFAITGNIASGKSLAESILAKDYPVFDTDKIAHEILDTIDYFYGYDVFFEGKIDRKKLGNLVFSNPDMKQKLEQMVHPKIKEILYKIFEDNKESKFVFVSVPLLFEAGFEGMFDKIILITTDEKTRIKRLMRRNNFTEEEAVTRIKSQMPEADKINKSDYIIENNSDIENVEAQINKILTDFIN